LQEIDRSLLLFVPPLAGLAYVVLGQFVSRWQIRGTLLILAGACLLFLTLSPADDMQPSETAIAVEVSQRMTDGSPPDEPSGQFGFDRWTAVYDISAHTVYLPNGLKLEAHSGLGTRLDDPRFVHERMRGATPPNVYNLTLREKPFHGVRALRLDPLDRDKVFGRTGLLAHTYMLGPTGHSNGCVVFKNYDAFLRAFDTGELKRLAVVARLEAESVEPPSTLPSFVHARQESRSRVAASMTPRDDGDAPSP
jgi:hypothetical protein